MTYRHDYHRSAGGQTMSTSQTADRAAIALTVLYVVATLLYGVLVSGSLLVAVSFALPGILVYALWRYLT